MVAQYFLDREELLAGDCVVRTRDPVFGPGWLWFQSPSRILQGWALEEVEGILRELEDAGRHAVGFISYEAGAAFDSSLPPPRNRELPLVWFGVFDRGPRFVKELLPVYEDDAISIEPEWEFDDYAQRFGSVKRALGEGDAYQINLTFRVETPGGELFRLFRRACGVEPPPYAAYLKGDGWEIASLSPELFFESVTAGSVRRTITMSPMKGTQRPGDDDVDMTTDSKSLAENLMIVDMVRNDLGRIAEPGTVRAEKLFQVESHRTVSQMTSTVEATTAASFGELLKAVFPPASVTGAPKVAACRLIAALEDSPREVYCGAIGFIEPGGDARFSVAIRTAWRAGDGPIRYGIGSGLVWDSVAEEEYEECLLKAEVLSKPASQWELIECFHRDAAFDGALLEMHWERLNRSATELGVYYPRRWLEPTLCALRLEERDLPPKIRVAVRTNRTATATVSESAMSKLCLKAAVALGAIGSGDLGMRHKTNSRQVFQNALERHPDHDEVLLFNERGEAAEFCRGNGVFVFGDRWVTPDPSCGCLPGVGARRLVEAGKAEYGIVSLDEVRSADRVYFINSIRGLIPVDVDWTFDH